MKPTRAIGYARRNHRRFVAELKEFIRFPSISNEPKHDADIRRCAAWLAAQLRCIGMDHVRIVPTRRHPMVYAAWRRAPGKPTILIYGHYDVQPVEPLDQWRNPPFDPIVKDNKIYGRGACDDKGQLFAHVKAIESFLKTERALPVNVKCLFEGDEETGSPELQSFVERHKTALRADAAVMSDTRMLGPDRPAIGYAQRGNLRFELEVHGPKRDLHSGSFGGVVLNPLQALCQILSTLHDNDGRVTIPGFYDKVREWSEQERDYMARTGPKDAEILRDAGVSHAWGESGFTGYERVTIRPSLSLNGLTGGYQGPGIKTVIPAKASAKLSIRTVPDQDPSELLRGIQEHIAAVTPEGVRARLIMLGVSDPALVNRNHPALRVAALAYEKGFGAKPVFLRSGGSVPAASVFQKVLGIPTVLMGFALPDDGMHAPNEKFHLPNLFRGIETCIWFLSAAARLRDLRRSSAQQEELAI